MWWHILPWTLATLIRDQSRDVIARGWGLISWLPYVKAMGLNFKGYCLQIAQYQYNKCNFLIQWNVQNFLVCALEEDSSGLLQNFAKYIWMHIWRAGKDLKTGKD